MDGVIADPQMLFVHTKRDAEDIFDKEEDSRRPEDVPTDDEHRTQQLAANSG